MNENNRPADKSGIGFKEMPGDGRALLFSIGKDGRLYIKVGREGEYKRILTEDDTLRARIRRLLGLDRSPPDEP